MKRQQIVAIILVLFIAATSVVSFVPAVLEVISLRSGSRGEDVRLAQERLKKWGYYKGNADGIFGKNTFNAVKSFQKKNGLLVDGIIGDKTSKAMGITLNGSPTPTKATAKATAKATPTPAKAKATTSGKSTAKSNATPYISLAPAAH